MPFFRKINKHIFVGPLPVKSPSGQSICFHASYSAFENKIVFDSNIYRLLNFTKFLFLFPFACFIYKGSLYFTGSRSLKGFLRDFWVITWGYLSKKKIINHIHGDDFLDFYTKSSIPSKFMIDFAYSKINIIVAPCDVVFKQFSNYPHMQFEVVENFYNLEFPSYFDSKSRFSKTKIIFLSNINLSKGIVEAIDVCHKLNSSGFNVTLDICGSVIEDDQINSSSLNLIIEDAVRSPYIKYHDYVSNDLKVSLLCNSSIMLHPTSKDLAPLSIIEALSAGCYVISTNTGCIRAMLDGYFSDICDKDISELANAIRNYISEPSYVREKMASHNMNQARVQFSLERYQSKLFSLLETL